MKTLVNKDNPQIRITAPEIDVHEEEQMYFIPVSDYCIPMCILDWTLVEEEPVDLEKAAEAYAEKHGFRVPYNGSNKFYDDVDVKASLEGFKAGAGWQKKQMCNDCPNRGNTHSYLQGYKDGQKEQKPAEWSEEDEKMRINILNALTPQLVYSVGKGTYTGTSTYRYDDEIKWLKSLKPQPHWKPSEKQMDFLKDIINEYKYLARPKVLAVLQSLYNNLKEL